MIDKNNFIIFTQEQNTEEYFKKLIGKKISDSRYQADTKKIIGVYGTGRRDSNAQDFPDWVGFDLESGGNYRLDFIVVVNLIENGTAMDVFGHQYKIIDDWKTYVSKADDEKVSYTGVIPVCPYCKKPTERTGGGGSVTAAYFPPSYDELGKNTNPDRNTITSNWHCKCCQKDYTVRGNHVDGFHYIL